MKGLKKPHHLEFPGSVCLYSFHNKAGYKTSPEIAANAPNSSAAGRK